MKITQAVEANPDATPPVEAAAAKMEIGFVAKTGTALSDINGLAANAPAVETLTNGWNELRLLSIGALGKGTCGNTLAVRISNNPRSDKSNDYKNYFLTIFDGGSKVEEFKVALNPDAIINARSYFIENVVNENGTGNGSDYITLDFNEDALTVLYTQYKSHIAPTTALTLDTFDPFLGINKLLAGNSTFTQDLTTAITGLSIVDLYDTGATQLNVLTGNALTTVSDGEFAITTQASITRSRNLL